MVTHICQFCGKKTPDVVKAYEHRRHCEERPANADGASEEDEG